MPYIKNKFMRMILDTLVSEWQLIEVTGNLNYFLYKLAKNKCTCYKDYRDFIGELEMAKQEIYRKQISPYEELKEKENGGIDG
jgi:hypothetical protein